MVVFQFGSWSVGSEGVVWCGGRQIDYRLSLDSIIKTGNNKRAIIYEWLVDIAYDNRFSAEDIYALNTAFIYAMDFILSQDFDVPKYALLAETFKEQQQVLNNRKNTDKINGTAVTEKAGFK